MSTLYTILTIIGAYFFIIFVVIRLVFPFMGFSGKLSMPQQIPPEVQAKIRELENASATPEQYLKSAYDYVASTWHAGRFTTIFMASMAFRKDLSKLWDSPGFAHCNTQNYILFVLLADSKFFEADDVRTRTVFFNVFIHQYLEVKLDGKWIDVDPAGASIHGKPFGEHIEWFG